MTQLNREANWVMSQAEFRDKMVTMALDVFTETPDYFAKYIRADHARYGKIAIEIGLKAQ